MAPRRVKVNKFDHKKLSANDVICPICRSILIKPITLPCSHGFCSACFEITTQNENVCPICRVRVGSFLRSATKSKKLINEVLWKAIQDLFPLQVKNKLKKIEGNQGDTYKIKECSGDDNSLNNKEISDIKQSESKFNKLNNTAKTQIKQTGRTNANTSKRKLELTSTIPEAYNKQVLLKAEKMEKHSTFLNNFATKEYTCRILCQNSTPKEAQKNISKESQNPIQKKNKRIQELTESEISNDRSNSIESECLYFKPIDYRHNPPSERLAPIKVPTRKPNVSPHIKILAPSGQNQININSLESAFVRLCSPISEKKVEACKKENVQSHQQEETSTKRKHEKSENKAKKKVKTSHKPTDNQSSKSKESIDPKLTSVCDTNQCKNSSNTGEFNLSINNREVKRLTNLKQPTKNLIDEHIKRSLQEQADFELATKLQQTYNQSSKYSTRSTVLKRMATKNQVKMEGIMTPYKVK